MRARSLTLPLLGAGLLSLQACATTSLRGEPAEADTATVPVVTVEVTTTESTVPPTTVAETTTTIAETTTTESTLPPETVPPETAPPTTVDPLIVPVAVMSDAPIQPIGSSSGAETSRAQWRLLELGFWLQEPNGTFEHTTRQAVMAFQKYYGLVADGVLGEETAHWMTQAAERPRGRSDAGTLVEVDKGKQLLFFIVDGRTEWILNTSTGTEIPYEEPNKNDPTKIEKGDSVTPAGLHKVNRERAEGWWEGDLGEIYRPKYFVGGVAVHGSNSIPNYPASHGCVRVSVQAMDWVWETGIMPMGIPVWVHGQIPA